LSKKQKTKRQNKKKEKRIKLRINRACCGKLGHEGLIFTEKYRFGALELGP